MKKIISILLLLCLVTTTRAQGLYEKGTFGTMHDPKIKKVFAATRYNGWQSFMATVYLPYMPAEWDPSSPKDPHDVCNKAIALYAPKFEVDGVYAPVEVFGRIDEDKAIPFIDYVGQIDYENKYISKFEDFPYTNGSYNSPFESKDAAGVMEAIQKFNKWTYEMFGWKGLDKEGNVLTKAILKSEGITYYDANDSTLVFNVSANFNLPTSCRDVIGHELTHGISNFAKGPSDIGTEYRELEEATASIMGLSFVNFQNANFDPIAHYPSIVSVADAVENFRNPKLSGGASAYKGTNYKMPGTPGYDDHLNGMVASHCFFIMVNGMLGFIDEDVDKGSYNVLPLDMLDKKNSWTIGLQLFFRTFMEKATVHSDFVDIRSKMLQTAIEMGYPVGSHEYIQVMNAWYAVGVGEKWDPGKYNADCNAGQGRLAESLHYGEVQINTKRATATKDPKSQPMYLLENCALKPIINTRPFLYPQKITYEDVVKDANGNPQIIFVIEAEDYRKFRAIDLDDNGVYTLDNDVKLSKSLVSVHWATRMAASYFQAKYNFLGMDGTGDLAVNNKIGGEAAPFSGFNPLDSIFYYTKGDGKIDNISKNYAQAIYHFALGHKENNYTSPEAAGIKLAFSNIMALGVKKESIPNLVYPKDWEIDDDQSKWNFHDVKAAGQAVYYKGQNYDITKPETIAGVMNHWYYILVKGTPWQEPNGWQNEVGNYCNVIGIKQELAEKIVFLAVTKYLVPNPTFEQMRVATQLAITDGLGYAKNSFAYIAVTDAWNAVGVGLPYNVELDYSPKDGSKNIYPLPIELSIETEYPQYEDLRIFEMSTSPYFDDNIAPVWRATSYKNTNIQPFADENNPGKSISFARFYLEPSRKYYWRSRLLTVKASECPPQNNPESLCNQLLVKKKWSPIYELETRPLVSETASPFAGQNNVHPWPQKFAINTNKGLVKTEVQVQEVANPAAMIEIVLDPLEDEEFSTLRKFQEVTKVLTDYQWRVRDLGPNMGSPEGVDNHYNFVGQTGPPVATAWSNDGKFIPYKTTKPQGIQVAPADNITAAPFGQVVTFSWQAIEGAAKYSLEFSLDPKFVVAIKKVVVDGNGTVSYALNQMPTFQDKAVLYWRIVPIGPTGKFIPIAQEGEPSALRKITIDHSLIPAVTLTGPIKELLYRSGANFTWENVPGAQTYQYEVKRTFDQIFPPNGKGETSTNGVTLVDLDILPPGVTGGYTWTVRAGAKDPQTQQVLWGKWATAATYKIQPPFVENVTPVSFELEPYTATDLEFMGKQDIFWAPGGYKFSLTKNGSMAFEKILPTPHIFLYGLHCNEKYSYSFTALNENVKSQSESTIFKPKVYQCSDEGKPDFPTEEPPVGDPNQPTDGGGELVIQTFVAPFQVQDLDEDYWAKYSVKVTVVDPNGQVLGEDGPSYQNGGFNFFQTDEAPGEYLIKLVITKANNENYAATPAYDIMVTYGNKQWLMPGNFGGLFKGSEVMVNFTHVP